MSGRTLIFGAGGIASDILDILARAGEPAPKGFVVDRDPGTADRTLRGCRLYTWEEVKDRGGEFDALNGIGRPIRRAFIEKAEAAGFVFRGLIDPSAIIFPSARIAVSAVIGAGSIVAAEAVVGPHVLINRAVLIGHHTKIEPFVSIQAGANIGGHGLLCEESEVAIGATIIDRITIGARTIVGAGAVVVRDAPPDAKMIGIPAKPVAK